MRSMKAKFFFLNVIHFSKMIYSIIAFLFLFVYINAQTFQTGVYTRTSESCVNVPVTDCNRICIGGGYNSLVTGSTVTLTPLYAGSSCSCQSITGPVSGYSGNGIVVTPTTSGATASITSGSSSCNWVYSFSSSNNGGGSSSGSSSSCFPEDATVLLSNGSTKQMKELQIGDKVMTSNGLFSEIYMFSHKYSHSAFSFISIQTESGEISLTEDHYIYVNDKLMVAKLVKSGDYLTNAKGEKIKVVSVSEKIKRGLYNPHTLQGDIVVNNFLTSTYTAAINPKLAHIALAPVRMLHSLGFDIMKEQFNEGNGLLTDILPNGAEVY